MVRLRRQRSREPGCPARWGSSRHDAKVAKETWPRYSSAGIRLTVLAEPAKSMPAGRKQSSRKDAEIAKEDGNDFSVFRDRNEPSNPRTIELSNGILVPQNRRTAEPSNAVPSHVFALTLEDAVRALVTGAAGFAGSHLVERLLAQGDEVCGVVFPGGPVENLAPVRHDPRLTLVEADLCDPRAVAATVETVRPDQVYHLAAVSSVRQSMQDPRLAFRVNTLGTLYVLEGVRRAGLAARILVVSSAEAYGESAARDRVLRETDPLRPVSPYAASKAAGEGIARRYAREYGLGVVRVRPFPHTGPRHAPQFAYSDWARQLVEIECGRQAPRLQVGNLDVCRDISDVRDVVVGYVLVLTHGQAGSVYNVCSGRGVILRDVLDQLIALAGLRVAVETGADRLRPQDVRTLVGSPESLQSLTGWKATIPLAQTLEDLLAYWRRRPALT